jgi:hypothetical protein
MPQWDRPRPCLSTPDIDTMITGTSKVSAWAMDPAFRSRGTLKKRRTGP